MNSAAESKRHAPATARNRDPIAAVLRELVPESGLVLEVASGTGEHIVHFAGLFPDLQWQPSDPDPKALASIRAWQVELDLPNLLDPMALDAMSDTWPIDHADAILCINMVHISPWAATKGLLRNAACLLPPGAPFILYGPYRRVEVPTAPSNEAFDSWLRAQNSQWGLRQLEQVTAEAAANDFVFERLFEMPANNLTVAFRRNPVA
jgi:hypothetical protein